MTRALALAALAVFVTGCASAPPAARADASELATPAEACAYRCTSTYAEVVAFLDALADLDPDLRVGAFGESGEGRSLPLVVVGADDVTAEAVRQTGKTRVLVFANIHAGEVAGKDAMLALLRDLATGRHAAWADSLVVLVAPIYNADGNERIASDNRPLQLGPVEGMGQRPNAAGLDLNRDFTKLASPEARALVGLIRDADVDVVVDLHTTNGTHMGYHLTYAPGLSPNTPPAIDGDLWDRWLPAISDSVLASDDYAIWHYGNVPGAFGEEATAPRGWYSYSAQPRYSSNYVGVRGRYGILSEAYSYAPFRERVAVTRRFVEEILDRAWAEATLIRRRTAAADTGSVVGRQLAVRATWAALPEPADVLLGEVDTLRHPTTGAPMLQRRDVRRAERMPAYVRFAPSEPVTAPSAYVVHGAGATQGRVRDLLDAHGVRYEVRAVWGVARQRFRIDSVRTAARPFQGVRMQEVFGAWVDVPAETGDPPRLAPALVVPVDQPLGRLAVMLLEPRSDDGVVAWALVPPDALSAGGSVPIERIP